MATGPQGPLLKNDGPACRVCGCTEHNACTVMVAVKLTAQQKRERWSPSALVGCSWVKVEGSTDPLCSACSGTDADLAEAIQRGLRMWDLHGPVKFVETILKAANARYRKRQKGA